MCLRAFVFVFVCLGGVCICVWCVFERVCLALSVACCPHVCLCRSGDMRGRRGGLRPLNIRRVAPVVEDRWTTAVACVCSLIERRCRRGVLCSRPDAVAAKPSKTTRTPTSLLSSRAVFHAIAVTIAAILVSNSQSFLATELANATAPVAASSTEPSPLAEVTSWLSDRVLSTDVIVGGPVVSSAVLVTFAGKFAAEDMPSISVHPHAENQEVRDRYRLFYQVHHSRTISEPNRRRGVGLVFATGVCFPWTFSCLCVIF